MRESLLLITITLCLTSSATEAITQQQIDKLLKQAQGFGSDTDLQSALSQAARCSNWPIYRQTISSNITGPELANRLQKYYIRCR